MFPTDRLLGCGGSVLGGDAEPGLVTALWLWGFICACGEEMLPPELSCHIHTHDFMVLYGSESN